MPRITRPLAAVACLSVAAAVSFGCDLPQPTQPTAANAAGAGPLVAAQIEGATVERGDFSFPAMIPVPAPCLGGGTLLITGEISGRFVATQTPSGRTHVTEHLDFSGLTATLDESTWSASPGAHEIWSYHLPNPSQGAAVRVHEGHSRFVAHGNEPDVVFVHRIRMQILPSGELHRSLVVFGLRCIGGDA